MADSADLSLRCHYINKRPKYLFHCIKCYNFELECRTNLFPILYY